MGARKLQFLVDEKGNKTDVVIPIDLYNQIIEELEELEDIKAFDEFKEKNEPTIPLREAIALRKQKNG